MSIAEWLDGDGYPTEAALSHIAKWDPNDPQACLDFVRSLWCYPDYVTSNGDMYRFATGGWSGNESLIGALQENVSIWSLCWMSSQRGGVHCFSVTAQLEQEIYTEALIENSRLRAQLIALEKERNTSHLQLGPGERLASGSLIYVEQWCDGTKPCAANDSDMNPHGHWRGGRRIELEDLLRDVAERQREACVKIVERDVSSDYVRRHLAAAFRGAPLVTEES